MRKSSESRKDAERNFWELHAALLEEVRGREGKEGRREGRGERGRKR